MSFLEKLFRGTIATSIEREMGHVETVNSQSVRVIARDSSNLISKCSGLVVPTAASALYAKGCVFVKTNALTGIDGSYRNIGTAASCLFKQFSSVSYEDVSDGGASNGPIIKKTLQPGEAYTGTTAGLMVKNYGDATATVPSGEFTGLYVNLKGLHTDPGNNTSLISAHVHASNTTVVHAGLWLYGDMTNGVKMSGSTLTSAIDISEATAVTNLANLPAAATDKVLEANSGSVPGSCNYVVRVATQTGTPIYLLGFTSKPS